MFSFLKSLFAKKQETKLPEFPVATKDFFDVERPKPKVEVNKKPVVKKASVVAKRTTKKKAAVKK